MAGLFLFKYRVEKFQKNVVITYRKSESLL
jgi:hypothetical protein